ncbi:MAG: CCA tRNA nucleotidyltransferase [Defluviitaleaceae bacterium]|nr:CCA tRNA nucleotidyltransferase [Defluviitaleaceae bacterium]
MRLPNNVADLIATLNNGGHEAYVVGGCVRDALMGRTPEDFDITTSATPSQVKALFRRTVDTGIAHGTVTVLLGSRSYEVTTFRQDGEYLDNRRPSHVTFTTSLRDDLSRRDFTMNAVAYHPDVGFIDPFGGAADIMSGCIRCVGDPSQRFGEDALRMLRAVRFSAQLGFAVEPATFDAIRQHAHTLANVSPERVRVEFIKLLVSGGSDRFADLLTTGLWQAVDPPSLPLFSATFRHIRPLVAACDANPHNRLSLLFMRLCDAEVIRLLKLLKFDNLTLKTVRTLVRGINQAFGADAYSVRRSLGVFGRDCLKNILYLQRIVAEESANAQSLHEIDEVHSQITRIHENNDAYTISALTIDGNILKQLGLAEGAQIGAILNYLLDEVCKDPSQNHPDQLKSLALRFAGKN